MNTRLPDGVVYTETVVHTPPEKYLQEAPYQIAIVNLAGLGRRTVRILGEYVKIGESVTFDSYRDNTPCYRRAGNTKFSDASNK
ncbi:MAG TPA: OB-fold domain-containing protein [Bryobacteraceae bacterium]|jgi:uncharacterized OB-fold protein|nr:OB-fold domain-containing protein [Bryobacteraceae bacterium]